MKKQKPLLKQQQRRLFPLHKVPRAGHGDGSFGPSMSQGRFLWHHPCCCTGHGDGSFGLSISCRRDGSFGIIPANDKRMGLYITHFSTINYWGQFYWQHAEKDAGRTVPLAAKKDAGRTVPLISKKDAGRFFHGIRKRPV